jgi:uncharacterized RDD family membrane protein YckC
MECPQCKNNEIDAAGVCLVCGHKIAVTAPAPGAAPESKSKEGEVENYSGMIKMDYSEQTGEAPSEAELPQWRKELSQRLQEIRQKKETNEIAANQTESKSPSISTSQVKTPEQPNAKPIRLVEKPRVRKAPQLPPKPPPRQKPLQPVNPEPNALKNAQTDPHEIESLIDNAVSRQTATARSPVPISIVANSAPKPLQNFEGKLVFLSRTLSGLVDLICVVLFVGIFIIAADLFGGIIVLDALSLLDFAALFLLMYFVYSLFFLFLTASSQTIGMMITELRVVGMEEVRPPLRKLAKRCFWHLVSLFLLGIGLLWGVFDRNNLCLHDRLSSTRVVRN